MPDLRHFYLLLICVLLGLLLSPAVLGRFSPTTHELLFGSVRAQVEALHAFDGQTEADLHRLIATDVTESEVTRFSQWRDMQRAGLVNQWQEARDQQRARALGRMHGLVIVLIAIVMLEIFIPWRGGVTARYALLGAWLLLMIAQPSFLREVPWGFVLVLLVVTVVAGVGSRGGKKKRATETER